MLGAPEAVEGDVRQDRPLTTEAAPADSALAQRSRGPSRRWVRARPADVIDVFVYVVVLNLAIEYVPSVVSEGFTLSLLTAVLLKLALELVIHLKGQLLGRLRAADTHRAKLAAAGRCGRSRPAASSSSWNWSTSSSAMR